MRRRIFLTGLAFTVLELGLDAVVLFALYPFDRDEAVAAAVSLAPMLGVSTLYWTYFFSRWLRGLDGDLGVEAAREAVVRFPRRSILFRTIAVAALGLLLAPTLAGIFGVGIGASATIAGTVASVAFATNVVRAYFYRKVLERRGRELFAQEPLRYTARCLRERLFVSTILMGAAGASAAVLYIRFLVGVPAADFGAALAAAPAVLVATLSLMAWDIWRATAPLMPFLVPERHPVTTSPSDALRIASGAPFRLAVTALAAWVAVALITALSYRYRGGIPGRSLHLLAGIAAVGIGLLPFQVAWHRRILRPAREAAAHSLVLSEGRPPRSRLTLRGKLLVSFVSVIGFAGIFAGLTALGEHDRAVAAGATAEAIARRDALLTPAVRRLSGGAMDADRLASLARQLSGRDVVLAFKDGAVLGRPELALPELLAEHLRAGAQAYGPLPEAQASVAFEPLGPGAALGVLKPWRHPGKLGSGTVLIFVFVVLALASAGLVLVAVQELTAPVRALAREAQRVGQGDLATPIPPPDSDELGELAAAIEYARRELAAKLRSIEELNASLEERVRQRTAELERTNQELRDAREEVVQAEKMASLGRLVAGIAHELNNPLNFVQNSLPPLKQAVDGLAQLAKVAPDPNQPPEELAQAGRRAGELRAQLDLDGRADDLEDLLRVMGNGVTRMAAIVRALRDFSRQSAEGVQEPVELERLVDDAAALLRHDLKGRVELIKDLQATGPLLGEPGPLTQVFMNLLKNAAQAIEGPGTIRVASRAVEGGVEVVVADSGKGIPSGELPKIFEPFFTTKPVGEGTGLGLAIVHGIVQKHGGRISVASEPGRGTEFSLFFPKPRPPLGDKAA